MAETLQDIQRERSQTFEEEMKLLEIQRRTERYYAPSVVLPSVAKEQGAELNFVLTTTLTGEGLEGDEETAGLGRASREIGQVINRRREAYSLFGGSSTRIEDRVIVDPYDQQEYIETVYLPPEKEKLETLAASRSLDANGRLLARLLLDASYPYEIQPGDTYIELQSREPQKAYAYRGRYTSLGEGTAHLCGNTEPHFIHDMGRGKEITVNGTVIALRKQSGDHTAVLLKPALLNGVRLPAGTVLIPEGNDEDGYRFGFGRLSMFMADDADEAVREFPSIAYRENLTLADGGATLELRLAIEKFKQRSGQEIPAQPYQLIYDYQRTQQDRGIEVSRDTAIAALSREIEDKLDDTDTRHIVRGLHVIHGAALQSAEIAYEDKKATRDSESYVDPKKRIALINSVQSLRLRLHKTFGADRVAEVEKLLDLKKYLDHALAPAA